jgi:catechol 2,3-dioxygenase-like lactoylglutathione lyase family enzyme
MLQRILHTGVAVPKLSQAIDFYKSLGFEVNRQFHKPDLDADIAMMVKGEATYEIFQFNNSSHPQVEFIRNHIAVYSDDLENDVEKLVSQGYKLTVPITEGVVYKYAFLRDSAGTNYEIATEKPA